jgi:apolipoprotein D and lipocalin family protein
MKTLLILAALVLVAGGALFFFAGCASKQAPLPTPERVDLPRFMGTWYVLGYTPLGVDKAAHNAIEHYHLAEGGTIETTYQFRQGATDGPLKTLTPVGRVYDQTSNAEWRMQFIWPFQADYFIMDLSADYQRTIIAHPNRKYAWIMARTPEISDAHYQEMLAKLVAEGFDREVILKVPHDWSQEAKRIDLIREAGDSGRLVVE